MATTYSTRLATSSIGTSIVSSAAGDGTTDDSSTIETELDVIIDNGQGLLYLPPGDFLLDNAVVPDQITNSGKLVICGAGSSLTRLIVNNTTGGLFLDIFNAKSPVLLLDIGIYSKVVNGGTGFSYVVANPNAAQRQRMFEARNVIIGPYEHNNGDYAFDNYLVAQGANRPLISNVMIFNSYNSTHKGDVGIDISDSYDATIRDCGIRAQIENNPVDPGLDICIKDVETNIKGEGGACTNTIMLGGDVGYKRVRLSKEPGFWFYGNHVNCHVTGVYIEGMKMGTFTDNLMYCKNGASTYRDFHVVWGEGLDFKDNIYRNDDNTDRYHIHLDTVTTSDDVTDIRIDESQLYATAEHLVVCEADVEHVSINLPAYMSDEQYIAYGDTGNTGTDITVADLVDDKTLTANQEVTITRPGTLFAPVGPKLTVSSGVITVTTGGHRVDTDGTGTDDDINTINGGYNGMICHFTSVHTDREPRFMDGTGNLRLGAHVTLADGTDHLTLRYDGVNSVWLKVDTADN